MKRSRFSVFSLVVAACLPACFASADETVDAPQFERLVIDAAAPDKPYYKAVD